MEREKRAPDRRWWESRRCAVCSGRIGRIRPWEERPRLVAPDGRACDPRTVAPAAADAVLATHHLACGSCFVRRWADVLALAQRHAV